MNIPAAVLKQMPKCRECGVAHERNDPHDPEAARYRETFKASTGRLPTWDDALAHCPRQVREIWEQTLRLNGCAI